MSETFETMIEALKENRQKLNQSNSFDEISQLWHEIKETYSKCSKVVEDIAKQVSELDVAQSNANESSAEQTLDYSSLSFSNALNKMQELSNEVKTVSITEIPSLIKQMHELKMFCLKKLEEEKVKMEEVK